MKKSEVDNFVRSGNIYERLGIVIGSLQVRDKKNLKREAFITSYADGFMTKKPAAWLLRYVPSLNDFEHKSKSDELTDDWKTLCTNMAFGHEKIRIIG